MQSHPDCLYQIVEIDHGKADARLVNVAKCVNLGQRCIVKLYYGSLTTHVENVANYQLTYRVAASFF